MEIWVGIWAIALNRSKKMVERSGEVPSYAKCLIMVRILALAQAMDQVIHPHEMPGCRGIGRGDRA